MTMDMSKITKGIIAGFVATIVLTILMMMKKMMGFMPELDPVHMMSQMVAEKMGMAPNIVIGWIMHFVIGSIVWGGLFSIFNCALPGKSQIVKGIMFGIFAWLLMMIMPMPMSGAGLFGLKLGMMLPVTTLMFHIIFGIVLGAVFAKLIKK